MAQFTKTIKMALKSSEEERALLRARSAVQRLPVIEWRQRMEDFHSRSIGMSRGLAGSNAFRITDCDGGNGRAIAEHDDWNPEFQAQPSQPNWDSNSVYESPRTPGPPGSPGQWSQGTMTPGPDGLQPPPRLWPSRVSLLRPRAMRRAVISPWMRASSPVTTKTKTKTTTATR